MAVILRVYKEIRQTRYIALQRHAIALLSSG
jgi:hypothetical protein